MAHAACSRLPSRDREEAVFTGLFQQLPKGGSHSSGQGIAAKL